MTFYRFPLALLCALGLSLSACTSGGDSETTAFVEGHLQDYFGPSVETTEVECPPIGREVVEEVTCTSTANGIALEWPVTTAPETADEGFGFDAYPNTEAFSDLVELQTYTLSNRTLGLNLESSDCPATLDAQTVGTTAECVLVADGVPFRGTVRLRPTDGLSPHPKVNLDADGAMIKVLVERNLAQNQTQTVGLDVEVSCDMPLISPVEVGTQFTCALSAPEANRTGSGIISIRDLSGEFGFSSSWNPPGAAQ